MRLKKSEYFGLGLNVLLTSIYLWYLFRTLFVSPAHAMLSGGGDGSKNYYTYLFHVLFGKGWHFDGMNYPWGEHISFADNQPLLAYPLSYLQSIFHFSINDLLMIMNLIIPAMFLLTSLLLCKFFIRLGVNVYLSAVFSLLLTFLAPNFYRVFGHFGLCYTVNIVLTLYWLFRYEGTRSRWYLLGLLTLNFFVAFIHMYNLLLGMIIMFFYAFAHLFLAKEKLREKVIFLCTIVGVLVLSFAFVKLLFFATDIISDRPQNPWGILHYITTFAEMCTSDYSHLGKTFSLIFDGYVATQLDEGFSYIGLIPLLYLFFITLNFLIYFFKRSRVQFYHPISQAEKYLLIIAFLSFLLSIGFPFVHGMSFLLDYLPSIKQFRSLGRISIITYFCVGIACVIRISIIFNDLRNKNASPYALYGLLTIVLFWTLEIFGYSKYTQRRVDESVNNYQNFFHLKSSDESVAIVKDSSYQCIIGMPFYCIGSEKVGKDVDSEFSGDLFDLSLRKGLPIVNTLMSRSSWKQSFQLMRLIGGPFADKSFFSASLNNKKILLIRLKEAYLTADEQSLISFCDSTGEQGRLVFYDLNWQKLEQYQAKTIDSLNNVPVANFKADGLAFVENGFDDHKANETLFGKGALDVSKLDSLVLLQQEIEIPVDAIYEFSVWVLVKSRDYRMPYCAVDLYDSLHNIILHRDVHTQNASDNKNYWFRMSSELNMERKVKRIKVVLHNEEKQPASIVDELQLRPLQIFLVKEDKEKATRMYQNHIIKLNP